MSLDAALSFRGISSVSPRQCWVALIVAASCATMVLACAPRRQVTTVPVQAHIEPVTPQRTIRVDGIATVQVSPDVVDLQITLSATKPRPKEAVAELGTARDALLGALRGAGISGGSLRLGYVDVSPRHRPHPDQHLIDGYEASITLVVTLTQFERIGEVMDIAASHGASRMHTRFRSTKMAQVKAQARDLALAAAQAKAAQMARFLNVRVGNVLGVEEITREGSFFGPESNVMVPPPTAASDQGLQPGALPLTLTVQVTYAIAPTYGGYRAYHPTTP